MRSLFAVYTWTKMFSPSSPENFSSAPLMNLASPPFGFKGVDSLSQSWKNSIRGILKHGEHFFQRGQINKMHFSHGMQTNSGYPQYFNTINVRIKLRDVATWYFIYRWDTTEEAIIKHYPSSSLWPPWNDFFCRVCQRSEKRWPPMLRTRNWSLCRTKFRYAACCTFFFYPI